MSTVCDSTYYDENDNQPHYHDQALDGIRPYNGFHASLEKRICNRAY